MDELSDEQLMVMFRDGAVEGFDLLFAKYHGPVYRFIRHVVQDAEQAEDLLQDVFLRVARAAPTYRPAAAFRTWLFHIARNRCLSALESARVRRSVQAGLDAALCAKPQVREPSPIQRVEAREAMQRLQIGLGALAERQREAIVLYAMEGMSYKDIARVMDIPVNTVKTLIHRARASLAKHLTNGRPGKGDPR